MNKVQSVFGEQHLVKHWHPNNLLGTYSLTARDTDPLSLATATR